MRESLNELSIPMPFGVGKACLNEYGSFSRTYVQISMLKALLAAEAEKMWISYAH